MDIDLGKKSGPAQPHSSADTFLELPGVALRYVEAGSGEPVVLIHGYLSTVDEQWLETGVFAHLASRFHVVAYDNRGHGKSEKFHGAESYGIELVNDLFRVMDALGLGKAHVVGYSMGANILARAMVMGRGRFLSATLGGAAGRYSMSAEERARNMQDAAALERGDATSHILRLLPRDQGTPTPADLKWLNDKVLAGKDLKSMAAIRRAMQPLVISMDDLARCREPVLGVVGARDPAVGNMDALKARMPQLDVVKVPGGTHGTVPGTAAFRQAVETFISRHPSANPLA